MDALKLHHLALERRATVKSVKGVTTLSQLNIHLHQAQAMPLEVAENNVQRCLDEIERNNDPNALPLEARGGEVLDQVNDVFNLMARKI